MGFWPFGGGKKQRAAEPNEQGQEKPSQRPLPENIARHDKPSSGAEGVSRQTSRKNKEEKSRRWSKSQMAATRDSAYGQQTLSTLGGDTASARQSVTGQQNEKDIYLQNPLSQSSLGPENFSVLRPPPTLHAKRSDYDSNLSRRKSSKRKAEDYAREREVRAMTSSPIPIPKRPATFHASSPLQRDTRNIPGDLNRKLRRPASEVSLPVVESFVGLEDVPNQHSFKIGMLAALSPRPTVKYDSSNRALSNKQSTRSHPMFSSAIVEESISSKQRIDDLADDLDAGGLRELMERDRKRREKKKESDRAKLQRRLQRRADRQKDEEEARRLRTEEYVKQSAARRENVAGSTTESPKRRRERLGEASHAGPSGTRSVGTNPDPFADPKHKIVAVPVPIRNPFEDEKEVDIMQDQPEPEDEENELEPELPVRSPLRNDQTIESVTGQKAVILTLSPPVSPLPRAVDRSSLSQGSLLARETTEDIPEGSELDRRASDQSSQKVNSWTNFFKRGSRRKGSTSFQGRHTPSEFSNTSRESFVRKQPPGAVPPRSFRRSDSATPQRTMSKFREDLPELPISPPDSRVQSPEAALPPIAGSLLAGSGTGMASTTTKSPQDATANTPTLSIPIAGRNNQFVQQGLMDLDGAGGTLGVVPISQSLASVDSEASWLSGRPLNRLSAQGAPPLQPRRSSLNRTMPGAYESETSEVADDEYFKRLSAAPEERRDSAITAGRRASSMIINLQTEADKAEAPEVPPLPPQTDEVRHVAIAHQPTVILRKSGRVKSKEALLGDSQITKVDDDDNNDNTSDNESESDSTGGDAQVTGIPEEVAPILRARSVEYKGHVRHVSAGSARLLDIRRASTHSELGSKKLQDAAKISSVSPAAEGSAMEEKL